MNKEQAFNILYNFTNNMLKDGKIETINDATLLGNALETLRQDLWPTPEAQQKPEIVTAQPTED